MKVIYDRILRPVLSAHDTPEAVAGGVALGLGIALTPTMGVQMPIAWVVATMCGANRVVAMAMVWISNPLTVAPMYYSEYLLGAWVLDREAVSSYHEFQGLWTAMAELNYLERLRKLSDALLLPLVVGSAIPAVLLGSAAYPLSLIGIRRYRRRSAARAAVSEANGTGTVNAAEEPGSLDKSSGLTGPKAQASLLLVAGLFMTSACLDGNGPLSRPGVPAEVSATGTRTVWSGTQEGTRLLLSPFHAIAGLDDFSVRRFEEFLSEAAGTHRFAALHVFQFEEAGAGRVLGEDGIPVTLVKGAGRWTSSRPSSLLAGTAVRNGAVLSSLLGASKLPGLEPGQSLRVLIALPAEADWENADSVAVNLPDGALELTPHEIDAEELRVLLNQPGKDRFEQLLGDEA